MSTEFINTELALTDPLSTNNSQNSINNNTINTINDQIDANTQYQYNIVMLVAYNGANYAGFQKQNHTITVQGELEKAISKVANEPIVSFCAGRTDAGVHGTNQVINFQTNANRSLTGWCKGTNAHLPKDIRILQVFNADQEFHARFSAIARRYRYILQYNPHKIASPHLTDLVTIIDIQLDLDLMNQACQYLLGEQDFKSFQAAKCQASHSTRCINHAYFKTFGNFIIFDIEANAFLYHMVRNIMGALIKVGSKELTIEEFKALIQAKDRSLAPPTAPANGLYLVQVTYNQNYNFIQPLEIGPLGLPNTIE